MKFHYIYFILIPVLMIVALLFPFLIYEYEDGVIESNNGFDDGLTALFFLTPTAVATILLFIRNFITAIIGACIYSLTFCLAVYMNYVIHYQLTFLDDIGPGPFFILIVTIIATILGIIQGAKLFKNRKLKRNHSDDLLDID